MKTIFRLAIALGIILAVIAVIAGDMQSLLRLVSATIFAAAMIKINEKNGE